MAEFPETNHSLIARVQEAGDSLSWTEFVRLYEPVVMRMARRRGLQEADARDVIQQVFVSVARSIPRWKAKKNQPPFRAWLTTVARNAITKSLARRPREFATGSTTFVDILHQLPAQSADSAEFDAEAKLEIFRSAAEQIQHEFTSQTWTAFWKTAVEGLSVAETSQLTGRTAGAIYVARFRVLSRLKEKINELSQIWAI